MSKIISKRGRLPVPEARELDAQFESFGIIIIDGMMSPEEIKRAQQAMKELREHLEELGRVLDTGWYEDHGTVP